MRVPEQHGRFTPEYAGGDDQRMAPPGRHFVVEHFCKLGDFQPIVICFCCAIAIMRRRRFLL
jgi:hypothetical protein